MDTPKFDARAYRNEYRKKRYIKKTRILDLRPYSGWKEKDGSYSKFECSKCLIKKESPSFYITSLRFCKLKLNFQILLCRECHGKRKRSPSRLWDQYKMKGVLSAKEASPKVKRWFQEEKEKLLVPS